MKGMNKIVVDILPPINVEKEIKWPTQSEQPSSVHSSLKACYWSRKSTPIGEWGEQQAEAKKWKCFGSTNHRPVAIRFCYAKMPASYSVAKKATKMDHLQILDSLLKKDYDRRATPTNHLNNATTVYCELYIRSFGSISPATMDYEVDLYLRQKWQDERLKHADITEVLDLNDPNLVKAIWKPEVYFPNAKHAEFQFVTVPNVLIRINPDGEILYMLRLKLTFSCMMDLSKFPLDNQICTMEVASFSKTIEELRLEWKTMNPVIMGKGLKMPQFEIVDIVPSECQESFQIGNYSCLVAEFYLSRSVGFHLVQSYLPTILIVVISWVSFWMDVDSVPGRTTLGVTTLLAVSSQSSAFVFCALLEFTFVNYMWRKLSPEILRKTLIPDGVNGDVIAKGATQQINEQQEEAVAVTVVKKVILTHGDLSGHVTNKNMIMARQIDEYSRLCFPLAFALFNVLYWYYYLA
ncbi:hypothetical protein LSTR_LSTR008979 [Laodelphax striatellus]|uniref:Neurotransmitter-gated ion-channel ligand-binding domain-containing protein n=1 Tax=Laodelphax striatellus TaxID=195883 RepID=A0A482WKT1_LAOST|nr:hypothetical protein LSTR_LSTR008979 [Laodelphax striatellus]